MSFILDQLKRSGRKRQIELVILNQMKKSGQNQGQQSLSDLPCTAKSNACEHAAQDLQTLPEPSSQKLKKRALLLFLILTSVVIYAGIFIWWQSPWRSGKPINTVKTSFVNKHKTEPDDQKIKADEKKSMPEPKNISGKSRLLQIQGDVHKKESPDKIFDSKIASADQQKMDNGKKSMTLPVEPEKNTVTDKLSAESRRSIHDDPGKIAKVPDFSELPASARKDLPEIKITSHLYKKESRLVSINGRIMSEGYNMDNGLYLEEITPDGVILTYRNYRFHIKAD